MLKQLQKCQSFVTILSVLIHVDGFQLPFHIKHSGKTNITAHEGENVEFSCIASDHLFQFCAFERANSGTICRRKWRKVTDCDAFKNRAEFTEGPNPNIYNTYMKVYCKLFRSRIYWVTLNIIHTFYFTSKQAKKYSLS